MPNTKRATGEPTIPTLQQLGVDPLVAAVSAWSLGEHINPPIRMEEKRTIVYCISCIFPKDHFFLFSFLFSFHFFGNLLSIELLHRDMEILIFKGLHLTEHQLWAPYSLHG